MRIILMRHGKPDVQYYSLLTAKDFKTWIYDYDHVSLCENSYPSPEIISLANNSRVIVCSNLKRSTESAKKLGVQVHRSEPIFREMQIPYISVPIIRLPAKIWSNIFRALWFCGFSKNTESLSKADTRAEHAASELEKIAAENDSVLFVGHRFLNIFIARHLISKGWSGPKNPSPEFWSYGVFELNASENAPIGPIKLIEPLKPIEPIERIDPIETTEPTKPTSSKL